MTPERIKELRTLVTGLRNAAEMSHTNDQDEAADALTETLDLAEAGMLFVKALQEPVFFALMVSGAIEWGGCPFSQAQLHAFAALEGK